MADLLKSTCFFLKQYGYLKRTVEPTSFDDIELTSAIARFQRFDANVEHLLAMSGKPLHADGVIGPATQLAMSMPRCGCPDFPDEDSGTAAARGRGGWYGCHGASGFHKAIVEIDTRTMPGFMAPILQDLLTLVRRDYAEFGLLWVFRDHNKIDLLSGERVDGPTNVQINWERGKGWIGLAIVGNPGLQQCHRTIWAKFDDRYNPAQLLREQRSLWDHELGHISGLKHSSGGIMNPTIVHGLAGFAANDPSTPILKQIWSGVPVEIPGADPAPPKDPPGDPDPPTGFKPYSEPFTLANGKRVFLVEMFGQ